MDINWLNVLGGVLVGGGGVAGLLGPFFQRARDNRAQEATDVQIGLSVLKEAIATLKDEKATLQAELADCRAQQKKGRPR